MIEEEGFTEKWKEIPGFPGYWVSDTGRVFSMKTKQILRSWLVDTKNYVTLYRNKKNNTRGVSELRERAFGRYFEGGS